MREQVLKALKITWGEIERPLPTAINQPIEYQRKKNDDVIHKPINYRLNKLGPIIPPFTDSQSNKVNINNFYESYIIGMSGAMKIPGISFELQYKL